MPRCTACGGHLRRTESAKCVCGDRLHPSCREYHVDFDCEASQERWIGAVEF